MSRAGQDEDGYFNEISILLLSSSRHQTGQFIIHERLTPSRDFDAWMHIFWLVSTIFLGSWDLGGKSLDLWIVVVKHSDRDDQDLLLEIMRFCTFRAYPKRENAAIISCRGVRLRGLGGCSQRSRCMCSDECCEKIENFPVPAGLRLRWRVGYGRGPENLLESLNVKSRQRWNENTAKKKLPLASSLLGWCPNQHPSLTKKHHRKRIFLVKRKPENLPIWKTACLCFLCPISPGETFGLEASVEPQSGLQSIHAATSCSCGLSIFPLGGAI